MMGPLDDRESVHGLWLACTLGVAAQIAAATARGERVRASERSLSMSLTSARAQ